MNENSMNEVLSISPTIDYRISWGDNYKIMYIDFVPLTLDQLGNQVAKNRYRWISRNSAGIFTAK